MYSNVRKKTGTNHTYKVETPTAVMDARGTHFTVVVDRFTGLVKIVVNAGVVEAGDAPILPSQQGTIYPWMNNWADLEYIDPEDITVSVSAEVIAKLLKNKALIDEENDELLNHLDEYDEETDLNLQEEDVMAKYKANVEHMLSHILKAAAQAGKLDSVTVEDIIETVNRTIAETNKQFDLERDVPPLDRTAGIDPEKEEQRREAREQAEQARAEREKEKADKVESIKQKDEEILERLEEKKREQQEANQQAEEEKAGRAREQYGEQLDEEKRQQLDERIRQRNEERERMDRGTPGTNTTNPPGNQGPASNPDTPDDSADEPSNNPPAPNPVATSTTIDLSDDSIVYGEPFTIMARVTAANSAAVPEGGLVEFKIGSVVIGTGTTLSGMATLFVDEDTWASTAMAGIGVGQHAVSATYAGGPQQFAGSASPGITLTVGKADTEVRLAASTETAEPGGTVTFEADVAVKAPGGGDLEGTVTLYRWEDDDWQPVGTKTLDSAAQSVTFEVTIPLDAESGPSRYKAGFVSESGLHNDSESEEKQVVVQPAQPVVYISKVPAADSPNSFEIRMDLANFTVERVVYEAAFVFRTNLSTETDDVQDFLFVYNPDKFDSDHDEEHDFRRLEAYDPQLGRQVWELRYEFFSSRNGVEFSTKDHMAKIVVQMADEKTLDDAIINLVYCQFKDAEGNPIAAVIQPGPGVNVRLDNNPFE
jgi:hypothetical protein